MESLLSKYITRGLMKRLNIVFFVSFDCTLEPYWYSRMKSATREYI